MGKLIKPQEMTNLVREEAQRREDAEREKVLNEQRAINQSKSESAALYESLNNIRKEKQNFINFKKDLKTKLFAEAVYALYNESFSKNRIQINNEETIKRGLVNKFINENGGAASIMHSIKYNSALLSEMCGIVDKYYNAMLEKANESKDNSIDIDLKDNFYEELINIDGIEDLGTIVKMRVANAIEEFNNSNLEDKMEIENIAAISKEKIASAKTEKLKEQFEHDVNIQIAKIKNRSKNIFEEMVIGAAKSAYTDENVKKAYTNESTNQVDYDMIIESCEVLYTFLETLNTAKIHNIDESYLEELISQ